MSSHTKHFTINEQFSSSMSRIDENRLPAALSRPKWPDFSQLTRAAIAPLALLFAGSTPHGESFSQAISIVPISVSRLFKVTRRKGRRITVEEARQIALRAMAITDKLLAEEREQEAEFLRNLTAAEADSQQ